MAEAAAKKEEPVVETPVEEVAEAPVEQPVDIFAEAFAQITAEPAAAPVAQEPVEPAAGPTGPAEPEEPVEGATGPTGPVEEKVEAPKPAAKDPAVENDILGRLAGLLKQEPQKAAPVEQEPQPQFSQDEMTAIDAYIKDFPDVAKAEAMIRRAEYKAVTTYIFAEVARELQPLVQMVRTLSERTYLGDLQQAVPDYGNVRDKVIEWAQNQPPYLKSAYDHVIKNGSVDEVADLIKRYQKETGTAPAAAGQKPVVELAPAVKKAVAALAPVGSKRSVSVAGAEPNDFDGAFEQFAKAG